MSVATPSTRNGVPSGPLVMRALSSSQRALPSGNTMRYSSVAAFSAISASRPAFRLGRSSGCTTLYHSPGSAKKSATGRPYTRAAAGFK